MDINKWIFSFMVGAVFGIALYLSLYGHEIDIAQKAYDLKELCENDLPRSGRCIKHCIMKYVPDDE